MSTDYNTYVGPYARCAVERIETAVTVRTCTNPACSEHSGTISRTHAFCSVCGAPVGDVPHAEMDFAIDDGDVSEAIDEALCAPGGDEYARWSEANAAHLWLPNRAMPGRSPHLESQAAFALVEITPKQIDAEILRFQITFEDALRALRDTYGADNVTIHWGVIQDYY